MLWLRRDLRVRDHPALVAAHEAAAGAVLPLFVIDPALWDNAAPARRERLAASLHALSTAYAGSLVVRRGAPERVVPAVAQEAAADTVHVTAESTPYGRRRDGAVRAALAAEGRALVATGTAYAVGPGNVTTGSGTAYQVFTPFARAWREHGWPPPAVTPRGLRWARGVDTEPLPAAPADPGAGEEAVLARWAAFLQDGLADYAEHRDRPDLDGTSRLSEGLKYGEVHPRTLLADVAGLAGVAAPTRAGTRSADVFVTELAWREFYADVLWHHPRSGWHDLKTGNAPADFDEPGEQLEEWQAGRTGYPFVDAGMRQLLASGWMHNRLRMVTASFLVKDLHIWWPHGARHFMAHLRDGDLASNSHGWQWTAGTGTDPAPFFRIFNPTAQGLRFDPHGDYVRRHVPELRHLPGAAAHEPWKHPAGYHGGYPARIVDHAAEREVALARYRSR